MQCPLHFSDSQNVEDLQALARWMNLVRVAMGTMLEGLKIQAGQGEITMGRNSMYSYVVPKNQKGLDGT